MTEGYKAEDPAVVHGARDSQGREACERRAEQVLRAVGQRALRHACEDVEQASGSFPRDAALCGDVARHVTRQENRHHVVSRQDVVEAHERGDAELPGAARIRLEPTRKAGDGVDKPRQPALPLDEHAEPADEHGQQHDLEDALEAAVDVAREGRHAVAARRHESREPGQQHAAR